MRRSAVEIVIANWNFWEGIANDVSCFGTFGYYVTERRGGGCGGESSHNGREKECAEAACMKSTAVAKHGFRLVGRR